MDPDLLLQYLARWIHILSAALMLGVPIFYRFVLMPALDAVDEPHRVQFRDALARRWRVWVYVLIVLFLATGLYNFLGGHAHWRQLADAADRGRYHMLFGIKFILALGMFFLASALAGRSAKLEPIRAKARLWLSVTVLLGVAVVVLSGIMRFMP